jgi:integrase
MAQTIALEGIIPCSVFHFHEDDLIFRFHELSHTFCTNLANAGMNPKALQYIMGHSNITMTLNYYAHATFASAKAEMERLIAA